MSNRFDSYLKGTKLARLLAAQATEKFQKGDDRKALRDIIAAFNALLVATNNFASLQFEGKRRRKKKPMNVRCDHTVQRVAGNGLVCESRPVCGKVIKTLPEIRAL